MTPEPSPPSLFDEEDASFDAIYPAEVQAVSRRFWTPVSTARRAAILLREAGATRVLDVGSGAGKFALVAAQTVPELSLFGIEQRPHLVAIARAAQRSLGLENVRFAVGDVTDASWAEFDGFYFFNPYAENLFDAADRFDEQVEHSMKRLARDVLRTYAALRSAAIGTCVVTLHSSSGRMPSSYELTAVERAGTGWLRRWIKKHETDDGSFFVEVGDTVETHPGDRK